MKSSRHGKFHRCGLQIHISQQISTAPSSRRLPSDGRKIIATHHGGGTGDTDGHARDAKHSESVAYEDNTCGFSSALSEAS